jgi:alpha-glucosidase
MTKYNKLKCFVLLLFIASIANVQAAEKVKSPDGQLCLTTGVNDGRPFYSISRGKESIINPSFLGFILKSGAFYNNFKISSIKLDTKNETWYQPLGEEKDVINHYNELTLNLQEKSGFKRCLSIVFRVFNDGVGFRYIFPKQSFLGDFTIMDELTEYALPSDAKAWSIPTNSTKYYEAIYKASPVSKKDTISTPVTLEVNDSLYMVLHEANLTDYASLNLTPRTKKGCAISLIAALTPWHTGEKVYANTPFVSPWRTIIITKSPGDLVTSRLMLNLNEPCKIKDTSWIKPGKYVGIWWGMHMNKYTWSQGPKHGATTANTIRYIDFAAKHGFDSVLVEGWNYGWDGDWTKNGDKFSFTRPYPDYDLKGLCEYARSKGIRIVAHNETGGATKNYENQLDSAFTLYRSLGINTIKTGYVNPIMDNKELQHSQYGIRHYHKVIETAAKYHLMVINHEPAMPTGLQRTYPNLISQEGIRGQEYNAWSPDGGNPPEHLCLIPFTRGLAGPMDFTPGIFNFTNTAMPGTHPQTTLAKQLAEYVIIYSPMQMVADMIENYEDQPGLTFIESCPTNWYKTIVLNAEIGKYVTIARKDRNSERWFIGSTTDSNARDISFTLNFLDKDVKYEAIIYEDGPYANYRTNPYPLTIRTIGVDSKSTIKLHLVSSGGSAILIKKK